MTISRSELIAELEVTDSGFFSDDPDQFIVRAFGLVLHYLNDEEIAYHVGRVLQQACHLDTYVSRKWGSPGIPDGLALEGLQRAANDTSPHRYWPDDE